ncbi:hypothetical protein SteCoe_31198 [Stentor coeruleus]|uniref:Mitochondrial carrier protein n=1 Tax=Stentor coeruleus TaxID=5963 RepID=A0A1R2B1X2_9CILI|nr:hypothetical protein SteCoe_31198 [Stentor coeruleus]
MKSRRMNNWNSGALAGVLGAFFLQPFDVLKTYSIVSVKNQSGMATGCRLVLSKYGVLGLWRGVTAAVGRALIGSGLYFLLLEEFKFIAGSNNIMIMGMCSGLAKVSITILCQPISVIKVRMESPTCQIYSSLFNAVTTIYSTEGIKGFYRGIVPSVIKDVPYSTLGYAFYEKYIQIFSSLTFSDRKNPVVTLSAGVSAGFTATIITQPFDVIKTRIQLQNVNGGRYNNMLESMKTIYEEDGLSGFQRGLWPRIAKRFFSFPLVWTLYEQIKISI